MAGKVKTKFVGVYQYVSEERRFDGKPDVCYYFTYKDQDKKFRWHKVGWRSEKVTASYASEKRAEFLTQMRNGEPPKQTRKSKCITFNEAYKIFEDKWFPRLKSGGADITVRYNSYNEKAFGQTPLDEITPLKLEDYKIALFQKGLAPATVVLIMGDIRNVINRVKRWGIFTGENPFQFFEMPKVDNARTRFLAKSEADLLLETLKKHSYKWHLIATISLNTGARLGEITGATIHDLQLETRVWQIRGKTGRRSITLNDAAYNAFLEAMKIRQKVIVFTYNKVDKATIDFVAKETGMYPSDVMYLHVEHVNMETGIIRFAQRYVGRRKALNYSEYRITDAVRPIFEQWMNKKAGDLIFTGRGGVPIKSNKTRTYDQSTMECGLNHEGTDRLDKVVFHTLRHTYCSWEAIKGTPLFKIARLVGHKTTIMTERYAHLCSITESQNMITKDNNTTMEQLNFILAHLVEQKGIEQVPQSVLDWLEKVS